MQNEEKKQLKKNEKPDGQLIVHDGQWNKLFRFNDTKKAWEQVCDELAREIRGELMVYKDRLYVSQEEKGKEKYIITMSGEDDVSVEMELTPQECKLIEKLIDKLDNAGDTMDRFYLTVEHKLRIERKQVK